MAHVTPRTEEQEKITERPPKELSPFERMKELTRRIITVPKSEITKSKNRRKKK